MYSACDGVIPGLLLLVVKIAKFVKTRQFYYPCELSFSIVRLYYLYKYQELIWDIPTSDIQRARDTVVITNEHKCTIECFFSSSLVNVVEDSTDHKNSSRITYYT